MELKGTTDALYMGATLYDLMIGNMDGSKLPDMSHFPASVVSRAHAPKKYEREYKKPNPLFSHYFP